jgi:hypothetical protein
MTKLQQKNIFLMCVAAKKVRQQRSDFSEMFPFKIQLEIISRTLLENVHRSLQKQMLIIEGEFLLRQGFDHIFV